MLLRLCGDSVRGGAWDAQANVASPYEMKAEEHPMAVPVFAQAGDVCVSFDLQSR